MKKLTKIIESKSFDGIASYKSLLTTYNSSKEKRDAARLDVQNRINEYKEKSKEKHSDSEHLTVLLFDIRIAEHQASIKNIEFKKAKFKLKSWVEEKLKSEPIVKVKTKKVEPKAKKAA